MLRKPFVMVLTRDRALASPGRTAVGQQFRQGPDADPEATHVAVLATESRSSGAFPRGRQPAAVSPRPSTPAACARNP